MVLATHVKGLRGRQGPLETQRYRRAKRCTIEQRQEGRNGAWTLETDELCLLRGSFLGRYHVRSVEKDAEGQQGQGVTLHLS